MLRVDMTNGEYQVVRLLICQWQNLPSMQIVMNRFLVCYRHYGDLICVELFDFYPFMNNALQIIRSYMKQLMEVFYYLHQPSLIFKHQLSCHLANTGNTKR